MTLLALAATTALYAQDVMGGAKGIQAANTALRGYFAPLSSLVLIIGALIGLIGGIKVYKKFSQGDPDAGKSLAAWGGGCVFLVLAGVVLKAFFGV